MSKPTIPFVIGQRVAFWTGRGSVGTGVIRTIARGRIFIDPDPDAVKGSDFRVYAPGSTRVDFWAPRDFGVRPEQVNTPPRSWYRDS